MKIYSMPEPFMSDTSVPLKWRLYGLINGFWINGLTVYAANKFFSDKLNCAERTISYALAELEKDKLVRREINGYKRVIHPYGVVSEQGATPLQGGCNPVAGKGATPLLPIASSIASNKTSETKVSQDFRITEGKEEDTERPKKETRRLDKEAVYKLFSSKEQPWWRHKQQKQAALALFDLVGVDTVRHGVMIMREHSDDKWCPQAATPFEYEEKREALKRYVKKHDL